MECMDDVFVIQQVLEKRNFRNLTTHLTYTDLEKACDTVSLKKLVETLTEVGLKTHILEQF